MGNEQDFFFISYIIHNSAVISESQCMYQTQRNEKTQKQGCDFHNVWKVYTIVYGFYLIESYNGCYIFSRLITINQKCACLSY